MTAPATTIAGLETVWASIDELLASLEPEQWNTTSLCPEWTVHGVVRHLAGVEDLLVGWRPSGVDAPPPFHRLGPFMEASARWSPSELLGRYRELVATRAEELHGFTDEVFDTPTMTPVGPGTYGRFMDIRLFDFWVHVLDMRLPLGRGPADEAGLGAQRSVDEVAMSIGYIAGKKIGVPDQSSIAFELSGPVERSINVKVDGRAAVVDELADPTARLVTDSTTFVLLACGRIDPDVPIEQGKITWSGDADLGERAARNLRFTM